MFELYGPGLTSVDPANGGGSLSLTDRHSDLVAHLQHGVASFVNRFRPRLALRARARAFAQAPSARESLWT